MTWRTVALSLIVIAVFTWGWWFGRRSLREALGHRPALLTRRCPVRVGWRGDLVRCVKVRGHDGYHSNPERMPTVSWAESLQ